jgi:hypothetical protein
MRFPDDMNIIITLFSCIFVIIFSVCYPDSLTGRNWATAGTARLQYNRNMYSIKFVREIDYDTISFSIYR